MSRPFIVKVCSLLIALALFVSVFAISPRQAHAQTSFKSLNYLYSISGNRTVAGQFAGQYWEPMRSIAGQYPGLWGEDFSFSAWRGTTSMSAWRSLITSEAKQRWASGALISMMFHACPPTQAEPCLWEGGVVSELSDSQWNELVTNGTSLNNAWKARLDVIVPYLQDLKNNGVEVLWRPFHEMNQTVFWWGGRPGANGTRKLYQLTRDYLVNTKGLTNLIWVWNVQDFGSLASDLNNYDPGSAYWDVLSLDVYWSDGQGYTSAKYNAMLSKAGNKPIAIGEAGTLPTSSILSSQPRWTFFMGWAELTQQQNTNAQISAVYNAANVVTLNEMPGWANPVATATQTRTSTPLPGATATRTPTPVSGGISTTAWYSLVSKHNAKCLDARSAASANGTVIQQYTCNSSYAQQYQFQLVSGNIYRIGNRNNTNQVLDVAGQSTADGGLLQLWANNGQTNQRWQAIAEGNGYYRFVNVGSGKCLDIPGGSTADSIQLQQWTCNGNPQQSFSLQGH